MPTLALTYRPQHFNDLVGQRAVQVILRQMVMTGRVPHAMLFRGSRGTGKTTTARILAAALNCARRDHAALSAEKAPAPCGQCESCTSTFDGTSMDVLEIDAASNGLVDDIRALRQQVLHRSGRGRVRVIIYDEAHSSSPAAFNAMLKTLEEPPPATVFILLTTEAHKIPDTVASRCMAFDFRRLSIADIVSRLTHVAEREQITIDEPLLRVLAEESDGAMRDALMRLEQVATVGMTTVEQYQRLIGHTDHCPAIITALTKGDLLTALSAVDTALTRVADPQEILTGLLAVLRDVLVLRLGGSVPKTGVALGERQNLALVLEQSAIMAAMRVFWQVSTQCKFTDTRQVLTMTVSLLADVLATDTTPQPGKRMTLAQMVQR